MIAKSGPPGIDLFSLPWLRRFFASRAYPLVFQAVFGLGFLLVILYGFLGPPLGENNLAVVVIWRLWWLLLPLSLFLLGRLWCGVCPMGASVDLVQAAAPWKRRPPALFLQKYGTWIMVFLFLGLFWYGMVRHVCCWPQPTAIVLLLLLGGAVVTGLVYQGRAWCRYLCPLGIFNGVFAMTGLLALRSRKQVCLETCRSQKRQVLLQEKEGCPFYELPMALDSNRHCNLCGECVKFCSLGSMRLTLRAPGQELWQVRRPALGEAVFVLVFMAVAMLEALQTTQLFPSYMKWSLQRGLFSSYDAVFTITLVALVAAAVGAYWLAAHLSKVAREDDRGLDLASFGYAYIPLALAAYSGVSIFRLAEHGVDAVKVAINQLVPWGVIFDLSMPVRGSFYSVNPPVKVLQFLLLAAGAGASCYIAWRIAKRREWGMAVAFPHQALVLVLLASFLYLILQPSGIILH